MLKKFKVQSWLLLAIAMIFGVMAPESQAALDTNLTTLVTDISSYWDTIKVIALAVLVFGVAVHYAKKLKR